jgi:iron(III) transport system permease protein
VLAVKRHAAAVASKSSARAVALGRATHAAVPSLVLAGRGYAATVASKWSSHFVTLGLAALAVLAPLALVLYQSFLTAPLLQPAAQLGLDAYRAVFGDPAFRIAFGTTALLASGMTAIAIPLGAAFAFLTVRTDLPGRSWLGPLILLALFIPSLVLGFGFVAALARADFLPAAISGVIGVATRNLHSLPSLIVLAGLIHVPHVYLITAVALRALDRDLEDAARSAGAGPWKVAIDVSLPMVLPAILFAAALVFLLGFQLLGLPLVLGHPQGILVLATYLYSLAGMPGATPYPFMATVAVTMMAVAVPLLAAQTVLLHWARRSVCVRANALPSAPLRLGWWRWPAFLVIVLWLAVSVLAPLAGITLRSFAQSTGEGSVFGQGFTFDHYRKLLEHPDIVRGIINTFGIGLLGGALAVACYTAIALALDRRPRVIGDLTTVARVMPGLVAGLALLWLFRMFPLSLLAHTPVSIWFAYTIVWLALGVWPLAGSLGRIRPELEWTARTIGASETRVRLEITLPLIRTGMLVAWLLIVLVFAQEYATGVFLLGPGSEMIGSLLVSLWQADATDLVFALSVVNVAIIGAVFAFALPLGARQWLS